MPLLCVHAAQQGVEPCRLPMCSDSKHIIITLVCDRIPETWVAESMGPPAGLGLVPGYWPLRRVYLA